MPGPEVAKAYVTIIPSLQGAQQTITQELTGASTVAGKKAGAASGTAWMSSMGGAMTKLGKTITAVTAPIEAVGAASFKMATDFETSFAQLTTIADTSAVSVDDLKTGVMDLSSELGISSSEISAAAYSAISAGQDTADALDFVTSAAKLARGGFTDVSTATDVLTTALNAYGLEAEQVTHVSDVLIEAQNEGKTTVDELAASMGRVIPTAANVNVGLEDLASQYVALTKNGIGTAEATTYINSMLNELGKSGSTAFDTFKTAAGMTFPEYIAAGHSTTEAMDVLADACEAAGLSVSDAFGSAEAGKAANVLVQHAEDSTTALDNMRAMAGQTEEAYATMSDTTAVRLEEMKTKLENLAITVGNQLIPILEPFIERITTGIETLSEKWNALDEGTQQTIITVAGIVAAVGPVLLIGGKLLTGISNTITAITTIKTTIGALSTAVSGIGALLSGPTLLIIAGVVAAIVAVIAVVKNWGAISEWFSGIWESVTTAVSNAANAVKEGVVNAWNSVKEKTTAAWNTVKEKTSAAWDAVKTGVSNAWSGIKSGVSSAASTVWNTVSSKWDSIKSKTSSAFETVSSTISSKMSTALSTVSTKVESIKTAFSDKLTAAKTAVSNAIESIKGFFNFSWSLPSLKLPHLTITGGFSISPPSVPHFSISWYKRAAEEGALFTTPQIIGVGDAAQPELLIGQDKLKELIGGGDQNITINVYGAVGQDVNALAEIIERKLAANINRRRAVFA